ncbi:MAG: tetratricopeptide repeat protein [Bacteroidetes bacterium]|nr:tetratricopeptide repeat protein [Bacteroidota bacterium]
MSSKKPVKKKKVVKRKIVKAKSLPPKRPSFERESVATEKDSLYKKIFKITGGVILAIMLLLSLGSGINGDDEYQNDYSEKLVNYYLSMGADTSALHIEKGKMHYYGGFFDLTTGLANRALGNDVFDTSYHHVRHLFNAIFGFLAIFFSALLAKEIAGWRAGILVLIFMFLSPRFLGHSLMNPKDIPFAAGFAVAIYYLVLVLKVMPKVQWKYLIGLSLGIALALATRAGGMLLFGYLFLFLAIHFWMKYGLPGIFKEGKALGIYAATAIGVSLVAYILAIVFWPAALVDPLHHPMEALTEFSKLGVRIRVLFMGDNIMSDNAAWYYPLLWIFKTIPLFVLVGFIGSLFIILRLLKSYSPLPVLLVLFATIFPVFYVIYKDSILHDGWRHLYFIYPTMVVAAGLFWITAEKMLEKSKVQTYVLYALLGIFVLESAVFIARNSQYPYVYFNMASGGISSAFGNYETDYWGVSVKQALDWMENEGIIGPDMQDTIILGTTFYYGVDRQSREKYNRKVRTKYVRFNQRYMEEWDYGIFPSRFFRGGHLRNDSWPNSKSIHTVKANGVPLLAVEKDLNKYAFKGESAIKSRDWNKAIEEFTKETEIHLDNELAWIGLANANLNLNRSDQVIQAANQALKIAPENLNALYMQGMAYLRKNDLGNALKSFQKTIQVNNEYVYGYYYLGLIYQQQNDLVAALKNALKSVELSPRFKAGYELVGNIYQQQGDPQNAGRYFEAASKL